jgi:TonB family protein
MTSSQALSSAPAAAPATLRSTEAASSAAPKTASVSQGRGEVLDQILPRPSSAALATVQGTVRVVVKVQVDAAGNVSAALVETPGPSKYFADQSVQAARGWVFNSPEVDGHSVPSEWSIRFEFTSSGVRAYPRQTKP